MLVNIKTAISEQEVCQNTNPPPIFVLFSPFFSLFFPIDILFSLKCPGLGPQSLYLGGVRTPPVGKPNIYSQKSGADSKEFNAGSGESGADSKEFGADSEEFNADSEESNADSEESNADSEEFSADSKEPNAGSGEFGADSYTFYSYFQNYHFCFLGGSNHE
jgi:hypothetical protein